MGEVVKIVGSATKAKRDHNKMLRDRIEGAASQPGTPESDADPSNGNAK
jgi:hypothetical protein